MGADIRELQPRTFRLGAQRRRKGNARRARSGPNKAKILQAPVTVIIGHDLDFAAELPRLMPHAAGRMQQYFATPGIAEVTAMRNGTVQGAYLIVAAVEQGKRVANVLEIHVEPTLPSPWHTFPASRRA